MFEQLVASLLARLRYVPQHLALSVPEGQARVLLLQLRDDQEVGDGRAVLLGLLVLRGERDAGGRQELPLGAGDVAGTEDLVEEEDGGVYCCAAEVELVADVGLW